MNKIVLYMFVCFSLLLSACAVPDSNDTQQMKNLPEISCVAVVPVLVPVSATAKLTAANKKALEDGAAFLDSVLFAELDAKNEFKILGENQLDAILSNPWGGRVEQIAAIGKATACGAVLETTISRYRQRVGTEMSAEVPAAAAYSMELIGIKGATVLWATSFEETQQALFDNILAFAQAEKRGFKWLSVQELSSSALKNSLALFPYFQEDDI